MRAEDCKIWNNNNVFSISITIGKTKRIVNNHYNSTKKSPKSLFKKSSNNKGGIESLLVTLNYIFDFLKILPKGSIFFVEGSDDQRRHVYSRLLKYGFIEASWYDPKSWFHKNKLYFIETT
jgi:hypothetical protein